MAMPMTAPMAMPMTAPMVAPMTAQMSSPMVAQKTAPMNEMATASGLPPPSSSKPGKSAKPPKLTTEEKRLKARGLEKEDLDDGKPTHYMPVIRSLDEIFEEDEEVAGYYAEIANQDRDTYVTRPDGLQAGPTPRIAVWGDAFLNPSLMENINRSKWTYPRKIQADVIPLILTYDCDLKGHAETGTGKTAAFMIPLIHKIAQLAGGQVKRGSKAVPYAIVVEPTRELTMQVYEQGRKLASGTDVAVGKTYGRTNFHQTMRELERYGAEILCTTMGRLRHFVENNLLDLSKFKFLVLDEADRMLIPDNFYPHNSEKEKIEFFDDLKAIVSNARFPDKEVRRNFLFSATFPPQVQEIADFVMRKDFLMVSNIHHVSVNHLVTQEFIEVTNDPGGRNRMLEDILTRNFDEQDKINEEREKQGLEIINPKRVLVFVKTKRDSDKVAAFLCMKGIPATAINGDRRQELREKSLRDFYNQEKMVLVATDVMARGIDIKELDHVVNYEMPHDHIIYVHRIGRTGRLRPGLATSFFDPTRKEDLAMADGLVKLLEADGLEVPSYIRGTIKPAPVADDG